MGGTPFSWLSLLGTHESEEDFSGKTGKGVGERWERHLETRPEGQSPRGWTPG